MDYNPHYYSSEYRCYGENDEREEDDIELDFMPKKKKEEEDESEEEEEENKEEEDDNISTVSSTRSFLDNDDQRLDLEESSRKMNVLYTLKKNCEIMSVEKLKMEENEMYINYVAQKSEEFEARINEERILFEKKKKQLQENHNIMMKEQKEIQHIAKQRNIELQMNNDFWKMKNDEQKKQSTKLEKENNEMKIILNQNLNMFIESKKEEKKKIEDTFNNDLKRLLLEYSEEQVSMKKRMANFLQRASEGRGRIIEDIRKIKEDKDELEKQEIEIAMRKFEVKKMRRKLVDENKEVEAKLRIKEENYEIEKKKLENEFIRWKEENISAPRLQLLEKLEKRKEEKVKIKIEDRIPLKRKKFEEEEEEMEISKEERIFNSFKEDEEGKNCEIEIEDFSAIYEFALEDWRI